jgi:hypothetical protein
VREGVISYIVQKSCDIYIWPNNAGNLTITWFPGFVSSALLQKEHSLLETGPVYILMLQGAEANIQ